MAAATASAFERYAHDRVGRAVGLTDEELSDLAAARFTSADPVEAGAYRLCGLLNRDELPLADDEFVELRDELGSAAVMEIVVLVGYYRTLAQLLHVFDVGVPADAGTTAH